MTRGAKARRPADGTLGASRPPSRSTTELFCSDVRRFGGIGVLATAILLFSAPVDAETPVIDVIGRRPERVPSEHAGQGEVIRPTDPTRFDTKAQLVQNSALAVPETGRITAAGFAVPRIRGQDTRLSEVYVEGTLLQDPFSGLPLVDELDLRAFGELSLYQGVAPPELATVNPVGVVQYHLLPVRGRSFTAGDTVGRPYGHSAWILGESKLKHGENAVTARLYARSHRTDGRYRYYDDNATPYNTADDRYKVRANNDRVADAALPALTFDDGVNALSALFLWQGSRSGLPSSSSPVVSRARETAASNVGTFAFKRRLAHAAPVIPDDVTLDLGTTEDVRRTSDPDGTVLGLPGDQALKVESRRGTLRTSWRRDTWAVFLEAGGTRSRVNANGQPLERRAETVYAGLAVQALEALTLEGKAGARAHTDEQPTPKPDPTAVLGAEPFTHRRHEATGASVAAVYAAGAFKPYLQWARQSRLPSLLEEFGDGAGVRAAPGITRERARHAEAGVAAALFAGTARLGAAAFQDDAKDRITLLPSVGQTLRADNVGTTRIRGGTVNADLFIDKTHLSASTTKLEALDLTAPAHPRRLPSVPERQATMSLEQGLGPVVTRWTSHNRSDVFRDPRNEVVIPGYWLHDLSLDGAVTAFGVAAKAGLTVLNLTDVTRVPVSARGAGAATGETGLSDVTGYPLPGRQWRLSLACTL